MIRQSRARSALITDWRLQIAAEGRSTVDAASPLRPDASSGARLSNSAPSVPGKLYLGSQRFVGERVIRQLS